VDVHHGDGMERIFWDDPRVMTISLHETGRVLFPGTGFPGDIGGPQAEGTAVNVALPPGVSDGPWLRAFHAVVPALVRSFQPQILFSQHGCDPTTLVPASWCRHVRKRCGRQPPQRMTDGCEPRYRSWAIGHDLEDAVDRTVMATSEAVFPLHGLDPWLD
jgi:hypothetical protein